MYIYIYYFSINIVLVDVLAPLGARTSAGTVMTIFRSYIILNNTHTWHWHLKACHQVSTCLLCILPSVNDALVWLMKFFIKIISEYYLPVPVICAQVNISYSIRIRWILVIQLIYKILINSLLTFTFSIRSKYHCKCWLLCIYWMKN